MNLVTLDPNSQQVVSATRFGAKPLEHERLRSSGVMTPRVEDKLLGSLGCGKPYATYSSEKSGKGSGAAGFRPELPPRGNDSSRTVELKLHTSKQVLFLELGQRLDLRPGSHRPGGRTRLWAGVLEWSCHACAPPRGRHLCGLWRSLTRGLCAHRDQRRQASRAFKALVESPKRP